MNLKQFIIDKDHIMKMYFDYTFVCQFIREDSKGLESYGTYTAKILCIDKETPVRMLSYELRAVKLKSCSKYMKVPDTQK